RPASGHARSVADAPGARGQTVRERRPRLAADLVGGSGRQPEPDLPGAARSRQRSALLAPEGDRDEARPGRSLRRRLRRHREVLRGLPPVARARASGARARQPAPPALVAASVQAGSFRLLHGGLRAPPKPPTERATGVA